MHAPLVPGSISTSPCHWCSFSFQLVCQRISVRGPVPEPWVKGLSPLSIQALYSGPEVTENRSACGRLYECCTA